MKDFGKKNKIKTDWVAGLGNPHLKIKDENRGDV